MDGNTSSLETLQDIRKIMERSSRFISLSGLSGVSAGIIALIGSYFAYDWITEDKYGDAEATFTGIGAFSKLTVNLIGLAILVFVLVLAFAFYFTYRRARREKVSIWDRSSRRLIINLFIPVVAGGIFILGMLSYGVWQFVVPASLMFYGLGCINASKYTYTDIRYLGMFEVFLGMISIFSVGYGLYFWAFGFGVLHIVYGTIMWWKYERAGEQNETRTRKKA